MVCGLGRAFAAFDVDYGVYSGHPADPRTPEPEEYTSMQPIGCAEVLVVYVAPSGYVSITGAYIGAEIVEADEFSQRRLDIWQASIQREVDRDREDAAADAWDRAHEWAA